MDKKILLLPTSLIITYYMPLLSACAIIVGLVGILAYIGYLRYKFWYTVARNLLEKKP
jgi:hypothetical protein